MIAFLMAATCSSALAQLPVIATGGVVNAASYVQPVASGSLVPIFGSNLATGLYTATTLPWPTTLGGTSVLSDSRPQHRPHVTRGGRTSLPWHLLYPSLRPPCFRFIAR